eukprot:3561126-Rhodomonas_salina.3
MPGTDIAHYGVMQVIGVGHPLQSVPETRGGRHAARYAQESNTMHRSVTTRMLLLESGFAVQHFRLCPSLAECEV